MLRVLEPVVVVLLSLDEVLLALLVLQHQLLLLLSHLEKSTLLPYLLFKMKTIARDVQLPRDLMRTIARDVQLPRDLFIPLQPAHHYPSKSNTITIIATISRAIH